MNWLDTPAAQALAWTLLHFLWEAAVIALILVVALRFARGSSRARYALATAAMLAMPLVFAATFALLLPDRPAEVLSLVPVAPRAIAQTVSAPLPQPSPPSWHLEESLPWAVPLWIAGVLSCYLRSLLGWINAQRLRRVGVCDPAPQWRRRVDDLACRLRISRPIRLLESALAEVPMVIGFVRPIILMPAGLLAGLPASQVEAILIHELAHIRRWDYLVNLAQSVVEGLLFYHPAVWWIGATIRAERENCCDDTVIEIAGDPHGYAVALTTLEEIRCGSREPALAATGGNLIHRIRRILRQPEGRGSISPVLYSGILLIFAAAILAAWPLDPLEQLPLQPPPPPAPQIASPAPQRAAPVVPTPYRKWLNEDVSYIVTDQERAAFQRLNREDQFENFIKEFWLGRDPTPGTVENEMKEEHYRRIAYANERFASFIPGWKTDRGRIYIMYGPSDETESHPSGDRGGHPYEIWLYRHIEGIGDSVLIGFFDAQRNGEYRMIANNPLKRNPSDTAGVFPQRGGTLVLQIRLPSPCILRVQIVNEKGETASAFEEFVPKGPIFYKFFNPNLSAGSYRATFTWTAVDGGQTVSHAPIPFTID